MRDSNPWHRFHERRKEVIKSKPSVTILISQGAGSTTATGSWSRPTLEDLGQEPPCHYVEMPAWLGQHKAEMKAVWQLAETAIGF